MMANNLIPFATGNGKGTGETTLTYHCPKCGWTVTMTRSTTRLANQAINMMVARHAKECTR